MASPPTDDLIYIHQRLQTRRRYLTPKEIEAYRRRGINLRRLAWFLTVPAGVVAVEVARTLVFVDGTGESLGTLLLILLAYVILAWRLAEVSIRLRNMRVGEELIESETSMGHKELVLHPTALVVSQRGKPTKLPRSIKVRQIAFVPEAIQAAQLKLAETRSLRGHRRLTEAEVRELERIRDSAIQPLHWVVGAIFTGFMVLMTLGVSMLDNSGCTLFTLAILAGGLLVHFRIPVTRRNRAIFALKMGEVIVVDRQVSGIDREFLPGSTTPWTQNGQPARWRYE